MSSAAALVLRPVQVSSHAAVAVAVAVAGLIVALCVSAAVPVRCGITPASSIAVQLLGPASRSG